MAARVAKKFYTKDPNKWIHSLGEIGVKVYPVNIPKRGEVFNIAVAIDGRKPFIGKKEYTVSTVIEGLYEALEYTYNKYCKDGTHIRGEK